MLYSRDRKYLFIHVPKTGGTSLVRVLKRYSDRVPLPLRVIGYAFDNRGIKLPSWTYPILGYPYHVTANTISALWGEERYRSYFKFGIVRNPWDLTVSEYHFIMRKKAHHLHLTVAGLGGFEPYVHWKRRHYARPQMMWLSGQDGRLLIDYVGRFESYKEDVLAILGKLGIRSDIPHLNATKRSDYRDYYTDTTMEIVSDIYRADIEQFGYTFS